MNSPFTQRRNVVALVVLALAYAHCAACGAFYDRTTTTRGGLSRHDPPPAPVAPGGAWGVPGVKVVTIKQDDGGHCTLVFQDGLYVGGTC
jgi:hypothetical protein